MAKYKDDYTNEEGVWRTIGGRRVFIRTGQKLSDAMKESGKFPSYKSKNPNKIKTKEGDVLTKKNEGLDENANIPEYTNYKGDSVLIPDADKYEKVKENIKGAEGKVYSKGIKGEKERAEKEKNDAYEKYRNLADQYNYNSPEWRNEVKRLREDWENKSEKFDKTFENYVKQVDEKDMDFKDRIAKNNYEAQKKIHKIIEERASGKIFMPEDDFDEEQAKIWREAGRKNAKIKAENIQSDDKYFYVSRGDFRRKFDENFEIGAKHENDLISAKIYTNDEFLAHLEDANWHTERGMLERAKLTNRQMEYVKEHTKVGAYTSDLDRAKTEKLINEAKAKYPSVSEGTKYSVTSASISRYQNMFKEYKKLHPNTKMDLQKFAKMMMDLG